MNKLDAIEYILNYDVPHIDEWFQASLLRRIRIVINHNNDTIKEEVLNRWLKYCYKDYFY